MSFLTLWLLVLIFERSVASKHRSINLALETVLQFDKTDDINVIKKVQNFLSHIQRLIDKKQQVSDDVITRRKKKYEFTDFVEDLITTLNLFEDNDLKQVFLIVDKDFRARKVNNDLIDDNVRKFLSLKLTEIRNQPASDIRRDLDRVLRELRADKNKKISYILHFVNSLYKGDSDRRLSKLIKRLNLFLRSGRKTKIILKDIIEKVINEVIYEHYNNLEDSEKGYIKMMVKAYLTDDIPTAKIQKIKQRAETEVTPESINTNEKTVESQLTGQVTELQLTPETFKDVSKETTKKKYTHITLYPKSIQVKKIPTGVPTEAITESTPTNEENIIDKKNEKTKETHEIFTNHSVEINVNLLVEHSQDSENSEDSQMVESFRSKSTPNKLFLRASEKSIKSKKNRKSSSPALSIETFGSLYRKKKPKRYNNKKKSRIVTHNGKTTMKDIFKTTYVDDIVKVKSVENKIHFVGDRRRFNKPTNLIKEKVSEPDIKDIVKTTKQPPLTTRALVSFTISTNKVTTPEVTTEKSTTQTTQNVELNEIFNNENVIDSQEITKTSLVERIRTTTEFVPKYNTTPFEIDSNNDIINETTVSEEPTIAFNINSYIKNSEVLNLEDDEKKKLIEEKMRADFGDLLNPTTNATTEGVTDIFKELEDAFEI